MKIFPSLLKELRMYMKFRELGQLEGNKIKEIDELIAGSSRQMSTFLQVLKETGARRGEAFNLDSADVDLLSGTV